MYHLYAQTRSMNSTVALTMPRSDSVSIVVAGKIGTGKSSLINSINGSDIATEGEAQTTQLKSYPVQVEMITDDAHAQRKAVDVTFWDSPGIGNIFSDEKAIITLLAEKCSETDLLLYCLDMRQRLSKDDVKGITQLTEALGPELWKNAVFVLTFSNEVKPPPGSNEDLAKHFKDTFLSWNDAIGRLLKERLSVPEEIIRDIAIVPAGYRQQSPPDRSDWFTPFWREAFPRVKESAPHVNVANMRVVSPYKGRVSRCVVLSIVIAVVGALVWLVVGIGVHLIIGISIVVGVILNYVDSAIISATKKRR